MAEGKIKGKYSAGSSDIYPELVWESKTDKEKNKSTITCTLYIRGKDGYRHYNLNKNTKTITLSGIKRTNTERGFDTNKSDRRLMWTTYTVSHDAYGKCSITLSAKHISGISLKTGTVPSKKITLEQIPRRSVIKKDDKNLVTINGYKGVQVPYTRYYPKSINKLIITYKTFTKTIDNYISNAAVKFTDSEIAKLEKLIGESTSFDFNIKLETYLGKKQIGNTDSYNLNTGQFPKIIKYKVYVVPVKGKTIYNAVPYIKLNADTIVKCKGVYIKLNDKTIYKVGGD